MSMEAQQQQQRRKFPRNRWLILIVCIILITAGVVLSIKDNQGPWINLLPVLIFTVLGVVIGLFQWLFPVSNTADQVQTGPLPTVPGSQAATGISGPLPPIIVQLPPASTQPLVEPVTMTGKAAYLSIEGVPPPTDPRTIQPRAMTVKDIYVRLTQPDTSAVTLTGIGGVGKSTLAALVYRYTEEQRLAGKGPFTGKTLWLKIDSTAVTMADLAGTIFHALGKTLPDLSSLAPHNQAATLFNALNSAADARLIVLDQFENFLDWQTGYTLPDRAGIGEWLDIINGQPCHCRILLTSRPWPQGTRGYPPTYMQEYHVRGLDPAEGSELLQKLGVNASEEELRRAVAYCDGHAYALTLLAALLRNRSLSLSTFFKDPTYAQLWTGNVARNLLDCIYSQQLDPLQRRLLLAFSVYREPVPFDAARTIADPDHVTPRTRAYYALDALLTEHLLQSSGEGQYQLHTIVTSYARDHFDPTHELANIQALRAAHAQAAQYYQQFAIEHCPPRAWRRRLSDVQPLVEAVWQLCQAEQWAAAYSLIRQEGIYADLSTWGSLVVLYELYQLLLPLKKWQPERAMEARICDELGELYQSLAQWDAAREAFEQALSLCRQIGDRREEGIALNNIGELYAALGNKERALELYQQALTIHREVKNRGGESTALTNIGWAYSDVDQMDLAREKYEEALRIRREINDRKGEARVLNSLGRVYEYLGGLDDARKTLEQALALCREVGHRADEGWTLNNLGRVYVALGQREQARTFFEESLRIRREVGARRGEGATLSNLSLLLRDMGEDELAHQYFAQSIAIRREVGDRGGEGKTLNYLGMLYAGKGQHNEALHSFKEALRIQRELHHARRQGEVLDNLGLSYSAQDRYDLALACFLLAEQSFGQMAHPHLYPLQERLDLLKTRCGDAHYSVMFAQVSTRKEEIIEQLLQEP